MFMNKEPKPQTLTLNKEFRHAYYQGKSKATPYFICYMVRGRRGAVRYGITTSKKIGGAVQRNRARRLLRAAFRSIQDQVLPGRDFVFVAREKILTAKSWQVAAAMKKCLKTLQQTSSPSGNSPSAKPKRETEKPQAVERAES